MIEHGPTWKENEINPRTLCKCGREFRDERGYLVHIGKAEKLSERVKKAKQE